MCVCVFTIQSITPIFSPNTLAENRFHSALNLQGFLCCNPAHPVKGFESVCVCVCVGSFDWLFMVFAPLCVCLDLIQRGAVLPVRLFSVQNKIAQLKRPTTSCWSKHGWAVVFQFSLLADVTGAAVFREANSILSPAKSP